MSEIDTSTAAIEALMQGVTPGPWQADGTFCENDHTVRVAMPDFEGIPQATVCECFHNWSDAEYGERRISWKEAEANAIFIAAARDLVPALAAERDNMRDEIAHLRSLMARAHAVMRECGWQLAINAEPQGDGILEAACTEIEAEFAKTLKGGAW